MTSSTLKAFLDNNKVKYVSVKHSPSYTAQEIAASAHIPGKSLAKTVIVKLDGKMAMVVEPANTKVDFESVKSFAHAKEVELASESEFQGRFPECELGAMPPFGNLYDMAVYIADTLTTSVDIAFNAGTHSELIKMNYKDFAQLVKPTVIPS
ncbi:MAG: YbaK/EbsC family protein [Pseudomonadota bacterium]|nr:YbaK/EbsC family protein [Pseudomonadota bacterium]